MARFLAAAVVCACAMSSPALSQDTSGSDGLKRDRSGAPIFSAMARTLPVIARNGMVVAQEARAAAIGRDILRKGGNAVDAAVATGFALAVTLPRAGNIGGGGFMLVHLAGANKTTAIDYRETAPAATRSDVFLDDKGEYVQRKSRASGLAVGVPGTVAGMVLAHSRYGSGKFTLAQLIAPAIALAREGIDVDQDLADSLPWATQRFKRFPSSAAIFLRKDGTPLQRGDRLVQRDLAESLEAIAAGGPSAFYEGAIARRIVDAVRAHGGQMVLDDLKTYRAIERAPVRGTYRGHEIVSMPPPSSGGVHIIQMLNMLEAWPLDKLGHNSAATIHLMAEAMKRAYADRSRYLGDPDAVAVPVAGLTSKAYAAQLRKTISPDKVTPAKTIGPGNPLPWESNETTHYSVVDSQGNAVSNTYTLNFTYGLGLVAPGTGILLNNELDDFAAKPNTPNAYGLLGGKANEPGPRKRPLSSMSPLMVFEKGKLKIVTGTPGGSRIITTVMQIVLNMIDHNLNAAEATIAPRVHHQWHPDVLRIERGISPDTIAILKKMGYDVRLRHTMGATQTIRRDGNLLYGATDPRHRGGAAAGY